MVTPNIDPSAFPVDGSYAMQQAWRLYFDKENVTPRESYTIEKNYPNECTIMCGRSYRAAGFDIKMPSRQQLSYIDKIFDKMMDNPKLTILASTISIAAMLSAPVFFFVTPIYIGVSALLIQIFAIVAIMINIMKN